MKLEYHAAFSLICAGILYAATRSFGLSAGFFIGGVLIDLDHLIDYVFSCRFRVGLLSFYERCENRDLSHAVLILHGWEYVAALLIVLVACDWNIWIAGTWLGFTAHMICDQVTNKPYPLSYFIIWRMVHGFRMKEVFPPVER